MSDISAADVMKLRKMSGQGMMDCKKALGETNGDVSAAMELLRKKGLATLEKRSGRETSEGLVVCKATDDGKCAVMATLCCETDFVAKSDDFIAAATALADYAMVCDAENGSEAIMATAIDGKDYNSLLTETVSKTGEKTQVGDYTKYKIVDTGLIATYIHFNGKVGTMVELETSDENVASADALKLVGIDVAMHITATNPLGLDADSIDPETIEQERKIAAEQVKNKPANIIDKIVDGKMRKFLSENCLTEQPFVKDDSKTVSQIVAEAGKQAGGDAKIKRFVRFAVG